MESARRLAAIVFVDVVGFSRMMADDEAGTLSALKAHRNVTDSVILNHGGRIVKATGDGLLIEFTSGSAAVAAAVEVQDVMQERNELLPDSRRMLLRIGINLAEVVADEEGDIFGDGVNVVARVEATADPGGIAMTTAVRDAVRGKLEIDLEEAGRQSLKNLPDPVQLWKVRGSATQPAAPTVQPDRLVGVVAVMPFENMSGEADQDYFADGITEDLITALSYAPSLGVVARNSTFAYRGSPKDVRLIARELDATHVVEGSVRKAGDRVRVTAQLIEAETGRHIWAERYDRELDDIFELQDELVDNIAARLRPAVWESAAAKATREATSLNAWDSYMRGMFEVNKHTLEGFLASIDHFQRAREMDPGFVPAISFLAFAWMMLAVNGWREEGVDPWKLGMEGADAAYALDSGDYGALVTAAGASVIRGTADFGERCAQRAIEINPHGFGGHHMLGATRNASGRPAEAIEPFTAAWRLGRHEPFRYDIANDLAWSHYMLENYDAGLAWGRQALETNPGYLQSRLAVAATLGQLGRMDEAEPHVAAILKARPDFSTGRYRSRIFYDRDDYRDRIVAGLMKAGLAE